MLPFFGLTLPKGFVVSITNQTINPQELDPDDAFAGYRLGTDGVAYSRSGNAGSTYAAIGQEWLFPSSALEADLYECYATLDAGALTSGTTGSWLALTSDRTWTVDQTIIGNSSATITVQIRLIGTSTTIDTATITLSATVNP